MVVVGANIEGCEKWLDLDAFWRKRLSELQPGWKKGIWESQKEAKGWGLNHWKDRFAIKSDRKNSGGLWKDNTN